MSRAPRSRLRWSSSWEPAPLPWLDRDSNRSGWLAPLVRQDTLARTYCQIPAQPENVQIRTWARNCVKEWQARVDAAREVHEAISAQTICRMKAKPMSPHHPLTKSCARTTTATNYPQWTCHHCLARLNDQFDQLLREVMFDQSSTEAQIASVGSLRQFDTKPWTEMTPDSSQSQLVQARAWGFTHLQELEARMDSRRDFYKAGTGSAKRGARQRME